MNISDEELAQMSEEELEEYLKSQQEGYGSPSPAYKDNIFKFFREILKKKDPTRVGNLKDDELGNMRLSVRDYLDLGAYARAEGLGDVADYLDNKAFISAGTSMSRKGFLAQLFVTQIKKEQKMGQPLPQKTGLFGGLKKEGEEYGQQQ